MKKFIILLCGIFSIAWQACAATNGQTSADFLSQNPDVISVGAGGTGIASECGANALFRNPSASVCSQQPEVYASYIAARDLASYAHVATAFPLLQKNDFSFGLGSFYHYFTAGNLEYNDFSGNSKIYNAESSYAASLSASLRWKKFHFGIAPEWVSSSLVETYSDKTLAFSIGAQLSSWGKWEDRIAVGISALHLSGKLKYNQTGFDLPQTWIGECSTVVYDHEPWGKFRVSYALENIKQQDSLHHLGGNYDMRLEGWPTLFLRSGYTLGSDEKGLTIGMGIQQKWITLNYAFQSGATLEDLHQFSLTLRFGRTKNLQWKDPDEEELSKTLKQPPGPSIMPKDLSTQIELIDTKQVEESPMLREEGKSEKFELIPESSLKQEDHSLIQKE